MNAKDMHFMQVIFSCDLQKIRDDLKKYTCEKVSQDSGIKLSVIKRMHRAWKISNEL